MCTHTHTLTHSLILNFLQHSINTSDILMHTHTPMDTFLPVFPADDWPMKRCFELVLEQLEFVSRNLKLGKCMKKKQKTTKAKPVVSRRLKLLIYLEYIVYRIFEWGYLVILTEEWKLIRCWFWRVGWFVCIVILGAEVTGRGFSFRSHMAITTTHLHLD